MDTWAQRHRQLRLFISSTFVDMNAERDALTRIFPQIRELCNQRGVEFMPLDLRWGITEEAAKEGRVIETCLREIEDSRPFFIGIIGDRYGWAPEEKDLGVYAAELKRKYPWMQSAITQRMSITEMEMQHAVLMRKDSEHMNAAFYIRTDKMAVDARFKEKKGSLEEKKLCDLKAIVRNQKQFAAHDYNSVDELAAMVLRDVEKFLNHTFPRLEVSSYDQEAEQQERILRSRSKSLIPFTRYQAQIDHWMASNGKQHLMISGNVGVGKSYLLTHIVGHLRQQGKKVVYVDVAEQEDLIRAMEYVGGEMLCLLGAKSRKQVENESTLGCVLSFFWEFIKVLFTIVTLPFRAAFGSQDSTQRAWNERVNKCYNNIGASTLVSIYKKLDKALKKHSKDVLYVALDNLDNLSGDDLSIFDLFENRSQVRILSSATINTKAYAYLQSTQTTDNLQMQNLSASMASAYVNGYLSQYGKSLDAKGEQCDKLLQSGIAGNPRLLGHVLELMVRFGSYEQLNNYINEMSTIKNEGELYELMLKHILAQFTDKDQLEMVRNIITAFAVVERGLSESEIKDIFNPKPMDWALLRPYLFSICRCTGKLWKPASVRCRRVLQDWMKERVLHVVDMVARYFENTLHCNAEHKDAFGGIDGGKIAEEAQLLNRQVQVLPELYYENGRIVDLFYWASYQKADVRFTEEQRVRYWSALYKAGYTLESTGNVNVSPYVMREIQLLAQMHGSSISKKNLDYVIKPLYEKYKWICASKQDLFQLYTRWNLIAGIFSHTDDMVWVSKKMVETSDQEQVGGMEQMAEYQQLLGRKEWDRLIAKAQTDVLDEQTRLLVDMFVTIAYMEKQEHAVAYGIAKRNVQRMLDNSWSSIPGVLPIITFFAELACSHGTAEERELALALLMLHKDQDHTRNLDTNNSFIFYKALAIVYLNQRNKQEAIRNAQVVRQILTTMGASTKVGDDIITAANNIND